MWSEGNYPAIAEVLMPVARALVDACAISAGQEVLDVAAGTGNVAVVAAEEGASVVASDLTPTLIELGRARSGEAGLEIEWVEADAEALPFEDARFDCVTSSFGAMFAPRPEVVARELFRVVRPGNTVGMANWTPEGFQGQLFSRRGRYGPPLPEGVPAPSEWGREEVVRERFEGLAGTVELERRTVPFEAESPEALWSFFAENAGPAVVARKMLAADSYAEMREDGLALIREWNTAGDGSVVIDAEYLLVVARRRG